MSYNSFSPHFSLKTPHSWLITGGCGFIGRSLIKNLVDEGGHDILVLDNLKVGSREDLGQACQFEELSVKDLAAKNFSGGSVQLVVGDILDKDLALEVAQGRDVIVHLAANTGVAPSVENPRMDCENNVLGTLNYLEAARQAKVKRFVFASSGAPAGEVEPPIHEELPPHPVSPYGASKLAGEGYCSAYYRTFGVETVCLRFGNVYGPFSGKKDSVVAKFIKRAISGEPLEIYGDGKQTRDFIYIQDLIQAIRLGAFGEVRSEEVRSGEEVSWEEVGEEEMSGEEGRSGRFEKKKVAGETFQIATNQETTISELVELLLPILRRRGFENIEVGFGDKRQGDVMRNFSDTSKARDVLGWVCQEDLESGLEKTVDWFLGG